MMNYETVSPCYFSLWFVVLTVVSVCLYRIAERSRHSKQLLECVSSDAMKVCMDV